MQPNSRLNLQPSSVPMVIAGEGVEGGEIIKSTVGQDTLWTKMVIVGHMVYGSHATTLANHAPPRNLETKMRQHIPTPWGDSGGTITTSLSDTNQGINPVKII